MNVNSALLSVNQARELILQTLAPLPSEKVPLLEAFGRILADDLVAQNDLPPFSNASMDGYAVQSADLTHAQPTNPVRLTVIGESAAGDWPQFSLVAGSAARITTGAPLPDGADAVIPVEMTDEAWQSDNRPLPAQIHCYQAVSRGAYIRPKGDELQAGQGVLRRGQLLRSAEIGLLASLGITAVAVHRRPIVGVLTTGNELVELGQPLEQGQIRNANGSIQATQIRSAGAVPLLLGIARDSADDVRAKLQMGLDQGVDFFVSSAGVSVGAHDVVKQVLAEGGEMTFWRVNMRPGKPLAFGSYQTVPYLGLPGNPVSALLSFAVFAYPALRKMQGYADLLPPPFFVSMTHPFTSDGRESYLRATVTLSADGEYEATLTGRQESHLLTSFLTANAIVIVSAEQKEIALGTRLAAWWL